MNCVSFVKTGQVFNLKKKQSIEKILEKWKKLLEKSGNFANPENWEPWLKCQKWSDWRFLLNIYRILIKYISIEKMEIGMRERTVVNSDWEIKTFSALKFRKQKMILPSASQLMRNIHKKKHRYIVAFG